MNARCIRNHPGKWESEKVRKWANVPAPGSSAGVAGYCPIALLSDLLALRFEDEGEDDDENEDEYWTDLRF